MNKAFEIALSLYGEKEIKGNKHNPVIVNWFKELGHGWVNDDETAYCFSGETEILTKSGWVRFDELSEGYQVAQVSPETHEIDFTEDYSLVEKKGETVILKTKNLEIETMYEHDFYGRWGKKGIYKKRQLSTIKYDGLFIPAAFKATKNNSLSLRDIELIAMFVADGFFHKGGIEFGVSKDYKIDKIKEFSYKEYTAPRAYGLSKIPLTTLSVKIPDWFNEVFSSYKELSRDFLNSLSKEQARTFLETYAIFDGYQRGESRIISTSRDPDFLVTLCVFAGWHCSVRKGTKGLGDKDITEVVYCPNKKHRHVKPAHIKKTGKIKNVYCVTVPKGLIIVRGGVRKSPILTGNCAAFTGYCLEKAGIESTKKLNARSYLDWGNTTKTPRIGDVVVFWRGKKDGWQGHVGFFVRAKGDSIYVLGGNQSDMVNIQAYPKSRLLGYRTVKENLPVGKKSLHTPVVRNSRTTDRKTKALIEVIKFLMGKKK